MARTRAPGRNAMDALTTLILAIPGTAIGIAYIRAFNVPLPFTATAGPGAWITLLVFGVENLLLVGTLGYTIGHRVVGLRVRSINGRPPSPIQTVVRTVLLCLFLPAMFWDRDGRGLHDKAAGTVIVRL